MHPCRQFPGHFVLHMPWCSLSCVVLRISCLVIGGAEGTVTRGTFRRGCEGTVMHSRLLDKRGGGYCALPFFLCKCPLSELITPVIQTQMYATGTRVWYHSRSKVVWSCKKKFQKVPVERARAQK